MHATAETRTLLEDWQARRERLSRESGRAEQSAMRQVRILDYLIHRYHDSPEATHPAPFIPKSELYVDERAIVVHHHVWQGEVGGSKSRSEAKSRVAKALHRLTSLQPHEPSRPLRSPAPDDTWPSSKGLAGSRSPSRTGICRRKSVNSPQLNW